MFKEGHVWNFHSWNDVWIKNKNEKYSGWAVLDGTPGGTGPAPIKAVHALDDETDFNVSMVISSVHSTIRHVLVENCDEKTPNPKVKPHHCNIVKVGIIYINLTTK